MAADIVDRVQLFRIPGDLESDCRITEIDDFPVEGGGHLENFRSLFRRALQFDQQKFLLDYIFAGIVDNG